VFLYFSNYDVFGARGGAVGLRHCAIRFPMVSLDFFLWRNPSGRTMALGYTQFLTEMSTRNISWG